MNWNELIAAAAARAGLSEADTRSALNAMREVASDRLAEGDKVVLYGLGTLRTRSRAPRSIRSVHDFRKMYVGERTSASFTASTILRRRLEADADAHWRDPEHQAAWRLCEALTGDLDLYHAARAPTSLSAEAEDADVRSACKAAFGPLWDRVVDEYVRDVPAAIRDRHDHLASAARTRWGRPGTRANHS